MRLLIYGGSFNPPHYGHVEALRAAREALCPDRSLVMPGYLPPHKEVTADSPPAETRLALAKLAFAALPGVEVSDLELRRGGVSYTVDTLATLRRESPEAELFFLVGTDMFLSMETWFRFREIFSLCTLAVLARNEGEMESLRRYDGYLQETYGEKSVIIPKTPLPVSSTQLRAALCRREGRSLLPESVYAEIIRRRLYGAQPELAWLREQVYACLKPSRVAHVAGCEQMAVKLAERWGADAEKAAEGAILHDITKKMPPEGQLRLCSKYGIITDTVERQETQLLHAKTGAELARRRFGADDEIYNAIFWHTTGRANMTMQEKILYLADAMEPTRQYEGVETLRRLAFKDLDGALRLGLEMSLAVVRARGKQPHTATAEALRWLTEQEDKI